MQGSPEFPVDGPREETAGTDVDGGGGSVGREGTSLSSQCPEGSASQLDLVPVSP